MPNIRISVLAHDQLSHVVRIHMKAFPESAITAFGAEAVRRYYLWLLEGPHDAALTGVWHCGQLVGFCAAGVFRGAMNGFLRRNRMYLATRLLTHPRLILSPLVRDRLLSALQISIRFSRLRGQSSASTAAPPSFGVLSIATDPALRVRGAGRALMEEAEQRARARGHTHMVLTVHPDNTRAIRFYEQLGWQRIPSASGKWSGTMRRELAV